MSGCCHGNALSKMCAGERNVFHFLTSRPTFCNTSSPILGLTYRYDGILYIRLKNETAILSRCARFDVSFNTNSRSDIYKICFFLLFKIPNINVGLLFLFLSLFGLMSNRHNVLYFGTKIE
jgi:hypothetical protein